MASSKQQLSSVILFLQKNEIKMLFRQELKKMGFEGFASPININECVEELKKDYKALLIMDWDTKLKNNIHILAKAQASQLVGNRSIFIITNSATSDILAIGSEYNVARVYSGEISIEEVKKHIQAIIAYEEEQKDFTPILKNLSLLQQDGEFKKASNLVEDALLNFPNNSRVLAEAANQAILESDWKKAKVYAKKLLTLYPDNLRGKHIYGRCLMAQGNFKEAIEILQSAKFLNPFHSERLIDLGNAYLNIGEIQDAKENFNQALEIDTKNKNAMRGKSQCLLIDGEINEALDVMNEFSNPREMAALFNNSAILSAKNRSFDKAIELYQSGINALKGNRPIISRLLFNKGIAFYKVGKREEAIKCFEESALNDPSFEQAKHNYKELIKPKSSSKNLSSTPNNPLFDTQFEEERITPDRPKEVKKMDSSNQFDNFLNDLDQKNIDDDDDDV